MEKPFLVCHMFVSMDRKIDGAFMGDPAAAPAVFSLLSAERVTGDGLWLRYRLKK